MAIKVKAAKAHETQLLGDPIVSEEIEKLQALLDAADLRFPSDQICFLFVEGMYLHADRKMWTACLFVNKLAQPIQALHGVLRLSFVNSVGVIAKTTVNFDEEFLGVLGPDEALLVHLGIPVKDLSEDVSFSSTDVVGSFSDVRVTLAKPDPEEGGA